MGNVRCKVPTAITHASGTVTRRFSNCIQAIVHSAYTQTPDCWRSLYLNQPIGRFELSTGTHYNVLIRIYNYNTIYYNSLSKAWVCSRSPAGIAGLNPAEGMDVCLLWVLCVCQVQVSATDWSLVQRSPTDCGASLCVISKPQDWGG
jgi:hypothetical protein